MRPPNRLYYTWKRNKCNQSKLINKTFSTGVRNFQLESRTVLDVAPRSSTTFPIKSFNFPSSIFLDGSDDNVLSDVIN